MGPYCGWSEFIFEFKIIGLVRVLDRFILNLMIIKPSKSKKAIITEIKMIWVVLTEAEVSDDVELFTVLLLDDDKEEKLVNEAIVDGTVVVKHPSLALKMKLYTHVVIS